jgi:putative heme-binding domain-containing protein
MYRKVIEHPDYLPEEVRKRTDFETGRNLGRIWRVRSQKSPTPVALPGTREEWNQQAPAIIARSESWPAQTAFRILTEERAAKRQAEIKAALDERATASGYAHLLRLLGISGDVSQVDAATRHPIAGVREVALQLLSEHPQPFSTVLALKADPDPRVRASVAGAVENWHDLATLHALAEVVVRSGRDRWTAAAVLSAAKGGALSLFRSVQHLNDGNAPLAVFHSLAGRLIGGGDSGPGNDRPTAADLAGEITSAGENAYSLLAGFAEAANIRLSDSDPTIRKLLESAASDLAAGKSISAALALLARAEWSFAREPLTRATSAPDPETAASALRILASFDDPSVVPTVLAKERWPRYSPAERETVLAALLARRSNFAAVLDVIESGSLPANAITLQRRDAFLKSPDESIRARAAALFGQGNATAANALATARASLGLKPEPAHGREVFRTLCASCHRLDREGHAVGPDLLDIRNQPKESILFHIVAPDAEIAPAFTAYLAETNDGRSLAGILTSENATSITLKLPMGVEETLLRSAVKSLTALPGSLMPAGLQSGTTPQGLADLLAFLKGE